MDALDHARKIYQDAENAMDDLVSSLDISSMTPDELDGEADRMWNDPEELRDFIGDRIFWVANPRKNKSEEMLARGICTALAEIGHPAMKAAALSFIKDYNLNLK